MNCPMCGAPLNDGDQMCTNCGTRRSEMGPAYNRPAQNSRTGGYGGNYGNTGYNNGGNYGNTGYNNGSNYGNTGYNNGSNYGNTGYNDGSNYGNTNSYGSGMGYSSEGTTYRSGTNRSSGFFKGFMDTWHRRRMRSRLISLVIIIVISIFSGIGSLINNRENTKDLGSFSITFPQRMKEKTSSVFFDPKTDDGALYAGKNVAFAYLKTDLSEFELTASDKSMLLDAYMSTLDQEFRKGLSGYTRKDEVNGMLRFYFNDDGNRFFSVVKPEIHGDDLYMFVAYCKESEQGKYAVKINRMLESIKFG